MSKLFFDNIIDLKDIEKRIKEVSSDKEETIELWKLVDELVHHKIFDLILGKLPKEKHIEFMEIVHTRPHDEIHIMTYLEKETGENLIDYIREEFKKFEKEILDEINIT